MVTTAIEISPEEQRALDEICTRLGLKYTDTDSAIVADAVADAHGRFDGGRIRDFVPLFVEREASARLAERG